jgi:hypothetical protein
MSVYKAQLEQDEDGRWSAWIDELSGCAVWEILSNPPPGRPQYQQLTRVEQFVPVIFMALFAALTIYAIYLLAT